MTENGGVGSCESSYCSPLFSARTKANLQILRTVVKTEWLFLRGRNDTRQGASESTNSDYKLYLSGSFYLPICILFFPHLLRCILNI